MNILLLTTYAHGGAGVACKRLKTALEIAGHQAQWLTRDQVTGQRTFIAERLSFLPFERNKSVRFSFSLANFGVDISGHPAVKAADVIHLHWINQGFLSLKNLAQLGRLGKPIIWTMHDMWPFTGGCHHDRGCARFERQCGNCPYLKWSGEKDLSHRIWSRKKALFPENIHFVACSEWLASKAKNSSLLREYSVTAIPNPIDTGLFHPTDEAGRKAFRQKIGASPDAFLLLFVAMNLSNPFKGFPQLKDTLSALRRKRPDLPVEVVAFGKSRPDDLEGLPYPLHHLGLMREPAQLIEAYGGADVFVTPSLEENLPNTIMESLACGTPAVGFQVGGIPEMILDGVNGYTAPLRDTDALADRIAATADQYTINSDFRMQCRRSALERYDQHVVTKRYVQLYEKALEKFKN